MRKFYTTALSTLLFSLALTNSNAQCISAVQLDGTDEYLHTPFNNYTFTNFTVEMWVNSQTFANNVHYFSLYQNAYIVVGDWASGTFDTWVDGLSPISINSGNVGTINTWHHVAFVYDGTNQILYLDGTPVATVPTTGTINNTAAFASGLVIGARYTQGTQFATAIFDDVRIWNVARNQSELQNAMNTNLIGNEAGLVAYYRFEDGTGSSTVTDITGNGNTLTMYNMDPATDWVTGNSGGSVSYGTDVITACDSYTWIDGNTYTASDSTATFVLTNAAGCDSIVTLDLTINTVDPSATQNGGTLTANQAGATYQWLDCDNGNAVIPGETAQSFSPVTITGNYAVEVTMNGCADTSGCFFIDLTGIEELENTDRKLVKIVDFMGRETHYQPNTPLIYMYDDGTIERVFRRED